MQVQTSSLTLKGQTEVNLPKYSNKMPPFVYYVWLESLQNLIVSSQQQTALIIHTHCLSTVKEWQRNTKSSNLQIIDKVENIQNQVFKRF